MTQHLPAIKKIIRFLFSGGTAAAINLLGLFVFVHYAHLQYLVGSILAFLIALVASFALQKFWTFRDATRSGMHFQFARFAGVAVGNLIVNTALMYLFVSILGIWYLLAQVYSSLLIAAFSYFIYSRFVFAPPAENPI